MVEAKKRRLPSVAPNLTCGAQGCGFEPRRRLSVFPMLKLTNVMCLFLLVAICESVICVQFSLQKYRPRANI